MIPIQLLEYTDKILPDDLVRQVYPGSYYCSYSDDNGESTLRWKYAKFHMPAWIGKTLKSFRDGYAKDAHYATPELLIVRIPEHLTHEQLAQLGMPVHMPSASMRKMHYEMLGKKKFGNLDHLPKPIIFTFGKYKGQTVEDVYNTNRDYLEWVDNNVKMEKDIKESIEDWLASDAGY